MFINDIKNSKIGLLKLDHQEAILYQRSDEFAQNPEKKHKHCDDWKAVGRIKNNTDSKSNNDEHRYFKKIVKVVLDFDFILVAAHGKGSANKGENLKTYIEKHHKNLRHKIGGQIATDNHKTENELLSEADTFLNFRW